MQQIKVSKIIGKNDPTSSKPRVLTNLRLNCKITKNMIASSKRTSNRLLQPIDDILTRCVDIHKKLKRSSQLLIEFAREFAQISDRLNRIENNECPDDLTINGEELSGEGIPDHRILFGRLDNCVDFDDTEPIVEFFKNEIMCELRSSNCNETRLSPDAYMKRINEVKIRRPSLSLSIKDIRPRSDSNNSL